MEATSKENVTASSREEPISPKQQHSLLLDLQLVPDPTILEESIELAKDKNVRISKLAETVLRDPVITLEILKIANSDSFSGEKSSIAAVQTGVIRIGSTHLLEVLKELKNRTESHLDPDVLVELKSLRKLSERASIVAEILSSNLQKEVVEIAQTCALLSYLGQMIICSYLKREYLELAHLRKRNALAYRLQSRFNINFQKLQLDYFKNRKLPPVVFYAFDRELKCKTTAQSSLRFIVESSVELVEAYEDGRWSKYSPNSKLPSKSNIRLLKISETQYASIFEEIEEALGISQQSSESKTSNQITVSDFVETDKKEIKKRSTENILEEVIPILGDIPLMGTSHLDERSHDERKRQNLARQEFEQEAQFVSQRSPTMVIERSELINFLNSTGSTVFIEKPSNIVEQEKNDLSVDSQAVIELLESLCRDSTTASELLEELMSVITEQGPFARAALIELSESRKHALVHTAVGENFEELEANHELDVQDPLNPLSTCSTKVQSFNARGIEDFTSPFGISAYAISPLKYINPSPLVLYADCGENKPLALEARKIFRLVVALLNQSLPEIASRSDEKLTEMDQDSPPN